MSDYTIELRSICEQLAGNVENSDAESVILTSAPKLFDFTYPFYDESKRMNFQRDFIRHFYMREIGQESVGLWKLRLRDWLIVKMPYYNKLFENSELDYDLFSDVDYTRTTSGSNNVTGRNSGIEDGTQTGTSATTTKLLDTPQDDVDLINKGYLTSVQQTSGNTTGTTHNENSGTNTSTGTSRGTEHVVGKTGGRTYSELVMLQRQSFINVEEIIFDAMNELFMQIY